MKEKNWHNLLSGTDIRGVALNEEESKVELTSERAEIIGRSFAAWLKQNINTPEGKLTVSVGTDPRLTGEKLKKALIKGITSAGIDAYDCGLASTPAMFMSTILKNHEYDGAVMITASHLPPDRNGFKFFTRRGGLEKEEIKEILTIASQEDYSLAKNKGYIHKKELIDDYSKHIVDKIKNNLNDKVDKEKPLKGLKIIVDAGNGAGGFFVNKILEPLGANTEGSQFIKPDGRFPNHPPNPEDETAIKSIQKSVIEHKADLGIIFDTDVDRAAVIDEKGQAVNRNRLIALASAILLEDNPGATIVTDSVTSKGLTTFIEEELGGTHHRYKRGYKNVINEALRLNEAGVDALLAIETSGHAAFRENHFLDDGAYLIAKILIKLANLQAEKGDYISKLTTSLEEAEISKEYRMEIEVEDFKTAGKQILEELNSYIEKVDSWKLDPENKEGIRVNCKGKDWFLLRMSLHDPVLVLYIESDKQKDFAAMKENLKKFLGKYAFVDLKPLK